MVDVSAAFPKMKTLSDERAARVVSLIENLAELEARENAEDMAAARAALTDYEKTGESVTLQDLEQRLGL